MRGLVIFALVVCMSYTSVIAQQALRNPVERNSWTQLAANGQIFNYFGMRPDIKGSVYLYERWKNIAILETSDGEKMMLRNVNFNVDTQQFEALFSGDSIFSLNTNELKSITLNNKKYRKMTHKGLPKMFELLYESPSFDIVKEYRLNVFEASYNPMVSRKEELYTKRERFYVLRGDDFNEINLNKKNAFKLLAPATRAEIEAFVDENKLSYKEEIDWINLLKHFIDY